LVLQFIRTLESADDPPKSRSGFDDDDVEEQGPIYHCMTEPREGMELTVERNYKSERTVWGPKRRENLTWKNKTQFTDGDLIAAMNYWQKACGVKFEPIKDDATEPFFTFVNATEKQETDSKGTVVAMSFFPGDGNPRQVTVFKVFATQDNKTAILAHELGHLLGFRHEHIWTHLTNEEIGNAELLTTYDPDSIMHYQKLWDDQKAKQTTQLSHLDIIGSQIIYGLPVDQIRDVMEIEI